jgi:hypothetical protein
MLGIESLYWSTHLLYILEYARVTASYLLIRVYLTVVSMTDVAWMESSQSFFPK